MLCGCGRYVPEQPISPRQIEPEVAVSFFSSRMEWCTRCMSDVTTSQRSRPSKGARTLPLSNGCCVQRLQGGYAIVTGFSGVASSRPSKAPLWLSSWTFRRHALAFLP